MGRESKNRRGGVGRSIARSRRAPVRYVLALLLLIALVPPLSVVAQGNEPPIVPIGDEDAAPDLLDDALDTPDPDPGLPDVEPAAPAVPAIAAPPPSAARGSVAAAEWSPPSTVYVPETGHTIDGVFLDLWRGWGGADGFGYPITPELEEKGRIVQYYGFARLEYWPEDESGNVVRFGELGREMRPHLVRRALPGEAAAETARAARAWLPLDAADVPPDDETRRFFPESGHGVAGDLLAFWQTTGGPTFLGLPLSEAYVLDDVTYQVFERGKVAQEAGGSPYLLPAGELVAARHGLDTSPVAQQDVPAYSEELFVPPPTPTPAATAAAGRAVDPNAERWIEIAIGGQYLTAYQGDVAVWEGYVSTGKEKFETPTGSYRVLSKLESQTMAGVLGGESYNVPDVPSVMYFTDRGHAIHGAYWHNNFGTPMSHGCVNLPLDAAAWLYGWAGLGTRVEIVP